MPTAFQRDAQLRQLATPAQWDVLVIGGGSTGLGVALDAVSRGYKTLLLEQADFAKGTSSRSTKLVHGGVRYLAQGEVALVREALRERGRLLRNAPHLVHNQAFIIPTYQWWAQPYYTFGLKLYDVLSGRWSLGASRGLSRAATQASLGNVRTEGLQGGIQYQDGQFDDARLAVNLAQTCLAHGATALNYMRVTAFIKDETGRVIGVMARDEETGTAYEARARVVVNATGVFVDDIMQLDQPTTAPLVRYSQGVHLVLPARFLPGPAALLIPRTEDGRVLFAVPWCGHVVLGTTDTPVPAASLEPRALAEEVEFILRTAACYLAAAPTRADVLSVWAGLRPLAAPAKEGGATRDISRRHHIRESESGLLTITGGKWTTFRQMGEDLIDHAIELHRLPPRPSRSADLPLHGAQSGAAPAEPAHWAAYGSDMPALRQLIDHDPALAAPLASGHPFTQAEVVWAARAEMARTVEDVLARRVRLLFLDARAALEAAPVVARLLARELHRPDSWVQAQTKNFALLAQGYLLPAIPSG